MRIAIFGTGAVGGYFGGRLAQAGQEVVFIARGENLNAIRQKGLRVDSIEGDFTLPEVEITDDPTAVGPVDTVIVGVKTWQLPEAIELMRPMIGADTAVLPLLNGVEASAQLIDQLGKHRVLGGLAKIICSLAEPGYIRHVGAKPYIALGELDNRRSKRIDRLQQVLTDAGVTVEIPPNIDAALWAKFLFVVSWGGVGTITRAPIGTLRDIPQTRKMLEQAMTEIFNVAMARKVHLPEDIISGTMAFVDTLPAGGTTSMQRDIVEGRLSEIEAWNAAVVRLGQEVGVETPLHTFIYHSLLPLELKARGDTSF